MTNFLKRFVSSDLGKGSVILFIMINIFNFLNYIFHFSMARMLTPADYGILGILMSLLYIYSIPAEAIIGVVSKYTTKFSIKKEYGKIKYFIRNSINKISKYGLIAFILTTVIISPISHYFWKIDLLLIIIVNLMIFSIFFVSIIRGVLQGQKKFYSLGWNMIIESAAKLIFAITFVLIGFSVFGSMIGLLLGFMAAIIFSFFSLKDIFKSKLEKAKLDGIDSYSAFFFLVMLAIVLMYSFDLFLARVFFSYDLAGRYTVISMLGKMIFFGTMPISRALFPVSSEEHAKGNKTKGLFYKSFFIIFILCCVALLVFLIIPELVVGILFGSQYINVSTYLIYIGVAMTFLSFTNLIIMYGLSIDRFKNFYSLFLYVFIIIEIILFMLFHDSLLEFSIIFMISNILLFIGSLILLKIK